MEAVLGNEVGAYQHVLTLPVKILPVVFQLRTLKNNPPKDGESTQNKLFQ